MTFVNGSRRRLPIYTPKVHLKNRLRPKEQQLYDGACEILSVDDDTYRSALIIICTSLSLSLTKYVLYLNNKHNDHLI